MPDADTSTTAPSVASNAAAEEPVLTSYGSDPKELLRYLHRKVKLTDEELVRVTGVDHPRNTATLALKD